MFGTLKGLIPRDNDLPARAFDLDVLRRVLDGTLYDVLTFRFHQERDADGAGEYIPLRKRQPSVRFNLCRTVVRDSVSLLFGSGRFPVLYSADEATRNALAALAKETRLGWTMAHAAMRGSIGSVAVIMRILKGRVFWLVLDSVYLTPTFDPEAPDTLTALTERRKVRGDELAGRGYVIAADDMGSLYWFERQWTVDEETWFVPRKVAVEANSVRDDARSVRHELGFVPAVWIQNLPPDAEYAIDGACTFGAGGAIETGIELDYQLSQAGRGLKYSSDPLLLIREPAAGDDADIVRSAGNALVVSEKGDAKLLEIGGTAAEAVMKYCSALRKMALESIRGNRSDADDLTVAQSGRALELLYQPLVSLADDLRGSYGEDALLRLVGMVIRARRKIALVIGGKPAPEMSDDLVTLKWRPYFLPSETDKQTMATALATLRESGQISQETAVTHIAPVYDIEDVGAEIGKIKADEVAADARAKALAAMTTDAGTSPG